MSADHLKAAFAHYGIDPEDRRYGGGRAQSGGWCTHCALHSTSNPRPSCDLEQARAAEMEELGFEARGCAHCLQAFPVILDRGRLCPGCYRAQEARDEAVRQQISGKPRLQSGRIPDGAGCTERVPNWMVDWDGNPNG